MKNNLYIIILLCSLCGVLQGDVPQWKTWADKGRQWVEEKKESKIPSQIAAEIKHAYSEYGIPAGNKALEISRFCIAAWSDIENWERTWQGIVTTARIYSSFRKTQKKITYQSLRMSMTSVPVGDSEGNETTLDKYALSWIEKNAPYLKDSSIGQDPAEALTYGLIYTDFSYLSSDLKIFKGENGKYYSLSEAGSETTNIEHSKLKKILNLSDNLMTLDDADLAMDDLSSVVDIVEEAQTITTKPNDKTTPTQENENTSESP